MAAGSSTIALRVTARRIALLRSDKTARQDRSARSRWEMVGHLDRAKALAGADLTAAIVQRLSSGEAMQARIALDRWRAEQAQEARRGQMAQAAAELDRLATLFAAEELTASDLLAAVEQVRLRTVITAWESLGVALRDRARRHGLEHLFTPAPRQPLSDEDPVVIASDENETQTLPLRGPGSIEAAIQPVPPFVPSVCCVSNWTASGHASAVQLSTGAQACCRRATA